MTTPRRVLGLVIALACVVVLAVPAAAQQEPTSTTTTVAVPTGDIVPQPNSGAAPQEAGDRGGVLQLGLLALVVVAVGGATLALVRQSRRARADEAP